MKLVDCQIDKPVSPMQGWQALIRSLARPIREKRKSGSDLETPRCSFGPQTRDPRTIRPKMKKGLRRCDATP